VELRHLRYFMAVAEELHFGRAAARLHIAQPPLSRQIQLLEREIGVTLFSRAGRRVRLSAAGEAFLRGTRRVLAEADAAVHDAQRAQRGEIGHLSLGFVGSATYAVLPALLRAFRARYPDVELTLEAMTSQEQLSALANGRIQVGLLRPPVDDAALALRTVLREPLVAVLPTFHRLAVRERVSLAALAAEPFILYPRAEGPAVRDAIVGACLRAGFSPNIVQEAGGIAIIEGWVASGLGVSLVIASPAQVHSTGVVYRPLEDAAPTWEMALAWRRDDATPVARAFLSIVADALPSG
jgi:DNA-binding transcriptional LysR family regulator